MWPSTTDGVTIERARFALDNLRVVGDAGPGDPRTTASTLELGFAWSASEQRPGAITFDDAPPGLYSQVALVIDGNTSSDSYEIRGRVIVDSDEKEFRIEDNNPLAFNVGVDEMLNAGESATIQLRINFKHALDAVDWDTVESDDGRLQLEDGDAQMGTFRTKLIESFEIVNAGMASGAR